MINEPFADGLFFVFVSASAAARHRARVEDDGCPACGLERGDGVLQPSPIRLTGGDAAMLLKASEVVFFIDRSKG